MWSALVNGVLWTRDNVVVASDNPRSVGALHGNCLLDDLMRVTVATSQATAAHRRFRRVGGSGKVRSRSSLTRLCLFLLGTLPAIALYCINAYERFGGLWDKSLWLWYKMDTRQLGMDPAWGPFNPRFLPQAIYTAFFLGPSFSSDFPWIVPTPAGQSLLTTSPALLLALRSGNGRWWLCVVLSMAGAMTVYSNGVSQLGARYWLLALPFLMMLIAETPIDGFAKILIEASVLLNGYFIWVWNWLGL